MNVAVTKTKAEQALSQQFEAVAAKLPGGRAVAEARKAAIGAFAALGLPHRRIEEWKYTDLRSALKEALPPAVGDAGAACRAPTSRRRSGAWRARRHRIVFVDGALRPELSSPARPRGSRSTRWRRRSTSRRGDGPATAWSRPSAPGQDAVIALNTAFMTDGAVVRIAQGAELAKPLLLVFVRAGTEGAARHDAQRHQGRRGRQATIIEAYVGLPGAADGQANASSEITVGDGAAARARQVHARRATAAPISPTGWRRSGAGRVYRAFQLTAATGLARNNAVRHVQGRGRQARYLRLRSWGAAPSTSTRRWWSITPCRAARAASCSRACWPTRRAASSRAR